MLGVKPLAANAQVPVGHVTDLVVLRAADADLICIDKGGPTQSFSCF